MKKLLCWMMTIGGGRRVDLRSGERLRLRADGMAVARTDEHIKSTYQDTLLDIARRHSLGYEAIIRANPGVNLICGCRERTFCFRADASFRPVRGKDWL